MKTKLTERVRITDMDDKTSETCSLEEFMLNNRGLFTAKEKREFLAGERMFVGGGAQPFVSVQLVKRRR